MAITIACPSCGTTAQVPDDAAGKKGKCRGCGFIVKVPAASVQKLCSTCGADVAGAKRFKDEAGSYYCESCWPERPGVASDRMIEAPAPTELFICECCKRQFDASQVVLHRDRVVCARCVQSGDADDVIDYASSHTENAFPDVRSTNWIIVGAAFGILFPPVGIPLQIWAAIRLLKLAKCKNDPKWIIASALPLIGFVFIKLLADKAGRIWNKRVDPMKVFDRYERERYWRLLILQRVSFWMSFPCWIAGKLLPATPVIFWPVGIVALIVALYSRIRLHPFHQTLREAGGVKVWFSDTSHL